ncbi:MAG: hypothetical protein WA317_11760 [Mycobacterium sp.]|uniref:hypothetical protein n=1 Tax=Mycobacterium sp. TaxID=1785 RepID=UPI003CC6BF53
MIDVLLSFKFAEPSCFPRQQSQSCAERQQRDDDCGNCCSNLSVSEADQADGERRHTDRDEQHPGGFSRVFQRLPHTWAAGPLMVERVT